LPKPDADGRRHALLAALGIAISVGLLFWALRGVSISDVIREVRGAHPAPLILAVIIATLTFPLRLIRWLLLLRDERGQRYPVAPLWHAIALGFTANNVLPLRAGELVRTYAAARLAPARFSTVLTSVAVERIFDALAVVSLLTLALLSPDLPSQLTVGGQSVAQLARAAAIAGAIGLLLAVLVLAAPLSAERVVRRAVPFPRLANALVGVIEGVRQGLLVLKTPGRLLLVVFWSLILWLVNALGFYVGFAAFDIPVSYPGALLLQGLLVLGISLPSTPGFFGPFEAVIVAVLALYRVPKEVAFSYAIVYHLTSFVPITLLGLWSLARNPGAFSLRRAAQVTS
jgi:glycosyltransferase 2 family protein